MKNENIAAEEINKTENDNKIRPTSNSIFFSNDKNILKKKLFVNQKLKSSLRKKSKIIALDESLIKKINLDNIFKLDKSQDEPTINKIFLINKSGNYAFKNIIEFNKAYNIIRFLHNKLIIRKSKNHLNNSLDSNLSINKFDNKNKSNINIKQYPKFISNISKENNNDEIDKKIKNINKNKNNIKSIQNRIWNLKNLYSNPLINSKSLNQNQSIDNETNILIKNKSISVLKFSSLQNKNKYLYGKMKKQNSDNFEGSNSNDKRKIKRYIVKTYLINKDNSKSNLAKDNTELNKIIYNVPRRKDILFSSKRKYNSFLEKSQNFSMEKQNSELSIYSKIINNNRIKKPKDYKLISLKKFLSKENFLINNKNIYENDFKSLSVPNKSSIYSNNFSKKINISTKYL